MDSIKIKDFVYGAYEINEPVLIELINSKPLQRLKGIGQHGWVHNKLYFKSYTRYDHSLGVMLVLRKLGAPLEEQVAGLLHDISHTAFSHVADYLYGTTGKDDYQDTILERFIKKTEIPKILKKYNLNLKQIEFDTKYTLLELPAPDVCADRFDYTIRETYYLNYKKDTKYILDHVINYKNKLCFDNLKSARLFAQYYSLLCKIRWGAPHDMLRYELTAKLLKYAKVKRIIKLKDLEETDEYIYKKLRRSKDKYILQNISLPESKLKLKIVTKNHDYYLINKFRYVDPKYFDCKKNKLIKYSRINPKYLKDLKKQKAKHEKGYKVKLLS
jgi:hypothetical protein